MTLSALGSFAIIISGLHCVIVLIKVIFSWTIVLLPPTFFIFLFAPPLSLFDTFFFLLSIPVFPQDLHCFAIKAEQICDHSINNQVTLISRKWRLCLPCSLQLPRMSRAKGVNTLLLFPSPPHFDVFCLSEVSCWSQMLFFSQIIPHPPLHRGLCYCEGLSSAQGSVGASQGNLFQWKSVQGWGCTNTSKAWSPPKRTGILKGKTNTGRKGLSHFPDGRAVANPKLLV